MYTVQLRYTGCPPSQRDQSIATLFCMPRRRYAVSKSGGISGIDTGGSGCSMNRGPDLLGPRVVRQKINTV